MTDETKPKRNRLVVDLSDDDRAWIREQAERTGWGSEALVLRMLVKDAREKGLTFSVMALGPQEARHDRFYGTAPGMHEVRQLQVKQAERRIYHPDPPPGHSFNEEGLVDAPPPVEPEYLDDVLSSRLQEAGVDPAAVATEPWPEMFEGRSLTHSAPYPIAPTPPPNGNAVAVSLAAAPPRDAKSYR